MSDRAVVVVAVLTYRRARLLARMLPEVLAQGAALDRTVEVLVVDNDPSGSAREVVDAVARHAPVPLHYAHEPVPGIVAGRNRALDHAVLLGAAALVFIDDDEYPDPSWLELLIRQWELTGAAAVAGPTVWRPDAPFDAWVEASGFYGVRRRRRATGTVLESAAAGNLLLDVGVVHGVGLRFDPRFAVGGGEDTFFARSLVAAGGVIRWCDEAVTVEAVPPERATRSFVRRRVYGRSATWVRVVVLLEPPGRRPRRRLVVLARAVVRVARAGAGWLRAVLRGDPVGRAHNECLAASAAGMVAGVVGRSEHGYIHT